MPDRRAKILLIEHDGVLSEVTAFRLELLGYDVDTIGSGQAALAALEKALPDLIILDPTLPDMQGTGLVNQLGDDLRTRDIPIMILSTSGDLHDVQAAHAAGAADYLVVPFDPVVLEQKLATLLGEATGVRQRLPSLAYTTARRHR